MFELKQLHKQWSLSKQAEKLNDEGYRTTQGKEFTKVQVKRILDRQSFYQGVYTLGLSLINGELITGKIEQMTFNVKGGWK